MTTAPTALERALLATNALRPAVTPLDALKAARRAWLKREPLDMGALAERLGTSRATLYRWVGDKDRLTSEVLWSLATDTLALAREQATSTGPDYVAEVLDWFMRAIAYHPSMRHFLERDPEYALRILTSHESTIRLRMTATVKAMLTEQVETGTLVPPLDLDSLSYVIVRIIESFMYSDLLEGADPDTSKATVVIRILLHADPPPPNSTLVKRRRGRTR
jgi:AcrR family transcriptional regulator